MSTASTTSQATETLVERLQLKALVEACLVVEEGIAGTKDVDTGLMAGAGGVPGPFAPADERGPHPGPQGLEGGRAEWGAALDPPLLLRRLVNRGRLGNATAQG